MAHFGATVPDAPTTSQKTGTSPSGPGLVRTSPSNSANLITPHALYEKRPNETAS